SSVDLVIHRGQIAPLPNSAEPIYIKDGSVLFEIPEVGRFQITNGIEILYSVNEETVLDTARLYILGSCIGAVLQQRGYLVLHGNAISIDGEYATIFIGSQGAGKSTMTAY